MRLRHAIVVTAVLGFSYTQLRAQSAPTAPAQLADGQPAERAAPDGVTIRDCDARGGIGVMPPVSGRRPTMPIDRFALVTRHNVSLAQADPLTPLSVGNGEFAFTADITGLQTFPEYYDAGMPLHTMSQWGWHHFPNPENYVDLDVASSYDAHGRSVLYLDGQGSYLHAGAPDRAAAANTYLRANPHRIDLGRIGLELRHADGSLGQIGQLTAATQTLNLWRGVLESRFEFDGQPVQVTTAAHPTRDLLAVRIASPLVASGALGVSLAFGYPAGDWQRVADWDKPERHETQMQCTGNRCAFARTLDGQRHYVTLAWAGQTRLDSPSAHHYSLTHPGDSTLELVFAFSPQPPAQDLPNFARTVHASENHWRAFWSTGGAIDVSGSTDPRASELERRVVLSQYLTAIQCAGSMPPQETGLVANSWFGKSHLEMHWWHAAHFALWGRPELLERSLPWYARVLPTAREIAQRQGYRGVRWPKMTAPEGWDSPSSIGGFLIWQQPHPIFYAELLHRLHPGREVLERYREIVFETAEFMASYAVWDAATQRYVLGPPLIPAQESYSNDRQRVMNPTFELAYWRWGLERAQQWRVRLGLPRNPEWDQVLQGLALPPIHNDLYPAIEVEPFTLYQDHPSMLAALGVLPPTRGIEASVMRATYADVRAGWDWSTTWGWDFPLMAMTAARVGDAEAAVEALFIDTPKNQYLANGHNYQRADLPLYLPGNGGLLYAVAMMAAGWDGAATHAAPGFPRDGRWVVHAEGLHPAP